MCPSKKELVKRQFSRRGQSFSGRVFSDEDVLERILEFVEPSRIDAVLDIATGAGFLAFKFAEIARNVIGIDLTREMLERAEELRRQKDIANVEFREGDVEDLPFSDESFDLVLCRYSFHHFPHPEIALDEMKRVCKRQGKVLIIDGTAPEDEEKSSFLNRMESIHNPSHVQLYSVTEFHGLFRDSGLEVLKEGSYGLDFYLDQWLDMADPDDSVRRRVSEMMEACLEEDRCGLKVRLQEGRVRFTYTIGMFLGVKG
jgi:SAM-dependent methyltransferase